MSTTATPNLALTYIVASQAQKEVTHNAALNDLDFLAQLSVVDYTLSAPPSSPATGAAYIVGPSPTGAWAGNANAVAGYYGGWSIKPPEAGWTAWTQNGNRLFYYTGSSWALLATPLLDGTISWNPGAIANAAGLTSSAITVTGAALGDLAIVAAPYDLQGIVAHAYVTAANTAKIQIGNLTGAAVTLGSGAWRVRVVKA